MKLNESLMSTTAAVHSSVSIAAHQVRVSLDERRSTLDERGEGVISVALAVLIMASLAGLMWVAYKAMWDGANTKTANQINSIG